MPSTILAIDPGYDRMGWAIGEKQNNTTNLIEYGYLQTSKEDTVETRYLAISKYVLQLIKEFKPSELALETLFFSRNQTTAMKVAEIRGIIIIACLQSGLTIHQYNPGSIKLTVTGYGKADKKAVEKMVRLQYKLLDEKIMDDALDAIAILMTHATTAQAGQGASKLQQAIDKAKKK